MNKVKKSIGLSVFGLMSCCLISGGIFITIPKAQDKVAAADVIVTANDSIQEWFNSDIIDNENLFFATTKNDKFTLKFNTNGKKSISIDNKPYTYPIYSTEIIEENQTPNSFYAFSDITFSLSRDGKVISIAEKNNSEESATKDSFVKTYTSLSQGFAPADFEMTLSLNTTESTSNEALADGRSLTLYQEGVYQLNMTYRAHYTTDGGESFEGDEVCDLSYTFYVFNKNTYLGDDNAPAIQFGSFTKTATGQDAVQYNYFYNFQSNKNGSLTYDPSKVALTITNDDDALSLMYDRESNSVIAEGDVGISYTFNKNEMKETLYFYSLGEYRISFEMIYTTASNERYTLPNFDNLYPKDQRVYVYGFNALYTKYDLATNSNIYPEFKHYEDDFSSFSEAADVSNKFAGKIETKDINLSGITPISTNQVPVKFEGNATLNDSQLQIYTVENGELSNSSTKQQLSKTYSTPGTYFAVFQYTFENLTTLQGSKDTSPQYQYFYFTITNEAPNVEVYLDAEGNSILRRPYTNQQVYVSPEKAIGEFDEDVIITVSREDFTTGVTTIKYLAEKYIGKRNIGTWNVATEKEKFIFTENGKYTVSWYHGRAGESGTPEQVIFTIDKQPIAEPEALSLIKKGDSYVANGNIDTFTNQPFVFSWNPRKLSGANTYGYVRYYALSEDSSVYSLSSSQLQYYANTLNTIPVAYKLDLSQAASWNFYENASGLNSFQNQDGHIRKNAGLYVIRIHDDAGNSITKIFVLDNTTPNFAINTPDINGQPSYELLTSTLKKISQDAEIYWGKYKGISFTSPNLEGDFYKNRNNEQDASVQAAFNAFSANVSNLSVLGTPTPTLQIEINARSYIQDEHKKDTSAKAVDNVYGYSIDYSYSLYYTGTNPDENSTRAKFYYSTSTEGIFREAVNLQTGERGSEQIAATPLGGGRYSIDDSELIQYKGTKYISSFDLTDLSYSFYIRDNSNTSGLVDEYGFALNERTSYLRYPSASKQITVSSDSSQLEFQAPTGQNGEYTSLPSDGIAAYSDSLYMDNNKILAPEENGTELSSYKYKNVYYYPTYLNNIINLSFIPTINDNSGKIIQVESVSVEYTPYIVQYSSSIKGNKVITTAYRTLGTPQDPYFIYLYEGTQQNTAQSIPLNVISQNVNGSQTELTAEGKYVITRKYVQPMAEESNFHVDKYDFFYRTIVLYVDRAGTISEAEPIEYTLNEYESDSVKIAYANNVLYSDSSLTSEQAYYVEITDSKNKSVDTRGLIQNQIKNNSNGYSYIYFFENPIQSVKLLSSIGQEQNLTKKESSPTTKTSIQSVVGSGILVNMYAGEEKADIAVQFPGYNEIGIGNGDSLYSEDTSYIFTTNKLPLTVNIPAYKYTYGPVYNESKNSFSVNPNDDMMQYHGEITLNDGSTIASANITQYNLSAEIIFNDGEEKYTSLTTEDNYLAFKDHNGKEIKNFTKAGVYRVKVIQSDEYANFRSASEFSFRISENKPEFEIQESSNRSISKHSNGEYYTNKKSVIATWQDTDDRLITNIDKKQIYFKYKNAYNQDVTLRLEINKSGVQAFDLNETLNQTATKAFAYSTSGNKNLLKIDLVQLGIYNNQGSFKLSMQFEGHDGNYKITTHTLNVDIQADSSMINELIGNIPQLTENNLRRHLNIEGDSTAGLYTYDVSVNSKTYKYFAYPVGETFFKKLSSKNGSGSPTDTSSVYIKQIEYNKIFEETEFGNFVANSYSNVESATPGHYYEIVESDLAGNLTIYTVYYYGDESSNAGLEITKDSKALEVSDKEIKSNKYNIFTYEGAEISNINFHGDRWLFFNINSTRYMKSPQLDEGDVYNLTTGKSEKISSLISSFTSSENKSAITIFDKESGKEYKVGLSIVMASQMSILPISDGEGVYISVIGNPSSNNISFFPTEIRVEERFDGTYTEIALLKNNPNDNLFKDGYNYTNSSSWTGNTIGEISIIYQNGSWKLSVKNPKANTKYKYTITDNFGKEWPAFVHLYGSKFTDSIDSSAYITTENGETWYKTSTDFKYSYNPSVYKVKAEPIGNSPNITKSDVPNNTAGRGDFRTLTLSTNSNSQPNEKWAITITEDDGTLVKTLKVHFYNTLPIPYNSEKQPEFNVSFTNNNGIDITSDFAHKQTDDNYVTLSGKEYRTTYSGTAYAGMLTVEFTSPAGLEYPYKATVFSFDNAEYAEGVEINSGDKLSSGASYYILFTYTDAHLFTNEYSLYHLTINDPDDSFFFVEYNGVRLQPTNQSYTSEKTGREYKSNYYIVNNSNTSTAVIVPNTYQKVNIQSSDPEYPMGITTIIHHLTNAIDGRYPEGVSPYDDHVVISYIPQSSSFGSFHYGTSNAFSPVTSSAIYYPNINATENVDSMQIRWSKVNGLPSNVITLSVVKDGKKFYPTITENDTYFFATFDISGTYKLTFKDEAGNTRMFGGKSELTLTFIKDVYFTMEHFQNGILVETEAINKGVFNDQLTLKLKNANEYYTPESIGDGRSMLSGTRNGVAITSSDFDYETDSKALTSTFTFKKPGYYQIKFSAVSQFTNLPVNDEKMYTFTILNGNESRYAYSFSGYEGYTISKVSFNNGYSTFEDDEITQSENYKNNTSSIWISHNTSTAGQWTITIDTGRKLTLGSAENTRFTYTFLIRSAKPPIEVSIPDGASSKAPITIYFNAENVYNSVGDCRIYIMPEDASIQGREPDYKINASTISTIGEKTITINAEQGNFLIQVRTESGNNLLYSYRVVKVKPMNGWDIALIIIGSVVGIVVIVLIFVLRKRIKVK